MQKRNKYQIMKNLSIDSARAELRYPCANALRMGRGCIGGSGHLLYMALWIVNAQWIC